MIDWLQSILDDSGDDSIDPKIKRVMLQLIDQSESIFSMASQRAVMEFPNRIGPSVAEFQEKMQDLFRGVLIKVFISIAWSDRHWSSAEKQAAQIILKRAWGVELCSDNLKQSLLHVAAKADTLQWTELLRPFTDIPELRDELPTLASVIVRLANALAKIDREVSADELVQLEELKKTLRQIISVAGSEGQSDSQSRSSSAVQQSQALKLDEPMIELIHATTADSNPATASAQQDRNSSSSGSSSSAGEAKNAKAPELTPQQRQQMLEEGTRELEALIGLDSIKEDVKQLISFLKMQSARQQMNLPATPITLHTLFTGNPGTGKTTVARIIGKMLSGLGILHQGHTVEADRSALVAQYAGQTGPKTHACVDKALGGVLFIDEAYSLVAENSDDAYGTEAVQVLLKRMEDDRNQLVVVLAGYPEPMSQLVRSNPGLSSRFQRNFLFPDYTVDEMLKIFLGLCKKNQYKLTKETAQKLHDKLSEIVEKKDEHFGNGRTVRNLFENALQRMASRVVDSPKLTEDLLTVLQPSDIEFA